MHLKAKFQRVSFICLFHNYRGVNTIIRQAFNRKIVIREAKR